MTMRRRSSAGAISEDDTIMKTSNNYRRRSSTEATILKRKEEQKQQQYPTIVSLKSCMSVPTLHDSLVSCSSSKNKNDIDDVVVDRTSRTSTETTVDSSTHSAPAMVSFKNTPSNNDITCISGADEAAGGKSTLKRRVSLGTISIREYERTLGDNPSVTVGPPVSIGWGYNELNPLNIDEYEKTKPYEKSRTLQELQIPRDVREALIKQFSPNTSNSDIRRSMKEINIIKQQRKSSIASQEVETVHVALESASRKMKRLFGLKPSKKQEMEVIYKKAENYKFKDCNLDTSNHSSISLDGLDKDDTTNTNVFSSDHNDSNNNNNSSSSSSSPVATRNIPSDTSESLQQAINTGKIIKPEAEDISGMQLTGVENSNDKMNRIDSNDFLVGVGTEIDEAEDDDEFLS